MMPKHRSPSVSMGITHADEAVPLEVDMKIICAWCDGLMAEGDEPVSHGICNRCFSRVVEHRHISDEEFSEALSRAPDVHEDPWTIWYLGAVTIVVHGADQSTGWAFDCHMSLDMVKTHREGM